MERLGLARNPDALLSDDLRDVGDAVCEGNHSSINLLPLPTAERSRILAAERVADRSTDIVRINAVLSEAQRSYLSSIYSAYAFDFTGTKAIYHGHAFNNAHRSVARFESDRRFRHLGRVLHISENVASLSQRFVNGTTAPFHACCPLLDVRDAKRRTEQLGELHHMTIESAGSKHERFLRQVTRERRIHGCHDYVCAQLAEVCNVQVSAVVSIDSAYSISPALFACIMGKHGATIGFISMFLCRDVFTFTDGSSERYGFEWKHYIERSGKRSIYFGFRDDMALGYVQDLAVWKQWIDISVAYDSNGVPYVFEIINAYGPYVHIICTKSPGGQFEATLGHSLQFLDRKSYVTLKTAVADFSTLYRTWFDRIQYPRGAMNKNIVFVDVVLDRSFYESLSTHSNAYVRAEIAKLTPANRTSADFLRTLDFRQAFQLLWNCVGGIHAYARTKSSAIYIHSTQV